MRSEFTRRIMIVLAILLAFGLCFDEASAQRRRNRRSRRVTNPVTVAPVEPATVPSTQTTDPQIISTADQQATDQGNASDITGQLPTNSRRTNRRRAAEPEDEADSMRRTVNELSSQVTKLSDKLTQMEQQQRTLVDMERLSRAEQRAENLRTQLRDVQEKEGLLQERMEQIDFSLKPENIERSVSTYGSTRPEEAREARRRMLESDKTRTRSQLELLGTSRQRLETAIINADLEVDKLRKRLEEADEQTQPKPTTTENTDETEGMTTTGPSTASPQPSTSTPPL
jgi:chromosome segregation ATPase